MGSFSANTLWACIDRIFNFEMGSLTPVGLGTFEGEDKDCVPATRISFGFAAWVRVGSACAREEA